MESEEPGNKSRCREGGPATGPVASDGEISDDEDTVAVETLTLERELWPDGDDPQTTDQNPTIED